MIKNVFNFIKGYKTYFFAFCGIVYGISEGNIEIILASLVAMGFRDALNK